MTVRKLVQGARNWIEQEGWRTVAMLSLFAVAGILFRVWDLGGLDPYADEYYHLVEARRMMESFPWTMEYTRGFWIVTFPVYLMFELFRVHLWAARLPGALLNLVAVVPLYGLVRRIDKRVAVVAVGLYVISPWVVGVARNIREYAVFPLIHLTVAWAWFRWLEGLPKRIDLVRDWRMLLSPRSLRYYTLMLAPVLYIFFIDEHSTLESIAPVYVAFGVMTLAQGNWRSRINRRLFGAGVGFMLALMFVGWVVFRDEIIGLGIRPEFSSYWLKRFIYPATQQWYAGNWLPAVWAILAIFFVGVWKWRSRLLWTITGLFLLYLYTYSFHFSWYERPRYGFVMEPWFIIVFSAALVCTFTILQKMVGEHRLVHALLVAGLAFVIIRPEAILAPLNTTELIHPITRELHYEMDGTIAFLEKHHQPEDVLVGRMAPFFWEGLKDRDAFEAFIQFDSKDPDRRENLERVILQYESGWFVIDKHRLSKTVPKQDFSVGDRQVQFLGKIDEHFLYYWGEQEMNHVDSTSRL